MTLPPVPSRYLGVWKRTLLEQQSAQNTIGEHTTAQDSTSLVLWMQTQHQHADIRIPALRPDFSTCAHLQDCSTAQLRWLATQQGFAGITEVQQNICQWRRELDFQPASAVRDIGEMVFDGDNTLLETGVESPYFEIWKKVEHSYLNVEALAAKGINRHAMMTPARLLKAGHQFAYIRPRSVMLPEASSLSAAMDLSNPNRETLLDWLDFEISFGAIVNDTQGQIMHSTLPFKEGQLMDFL